MLPTRLRLLSSLMRAGHSAAGGRGGAAAFSTAMRHPLPPPPPPRARSTSSSTSSTRQPWRYLTAAGLGGCGLAVCAAAAARQEHREEEGEAPQPSTLTAAAAWARAAAASPLEGLGAARPPPPADDDEEDAAAAAAVAASLEAWPLPTAKLACARRQAPPPPPSSSSSSSPPRPVVLVAAGAFNPPTIAHLRMVEVAADALKRAGIDVWGAYLSPVGDGYGAAKPGGLAPAHHRVAMCRAAAAGVPGLMVDAWEALEGTGGAGGPPTRTLHVLRRVAAGLEREVAAAAAISGRGDATPLPPPPPPAQRPRVVLVCGSDLLASLARPGVWKPHHIAALGGPDHGIVVVGRAAPVGGSGGGAGGGGAAPSPPADAAAAAALAPGGALEALAPAVTCVADPADLRGVSSSLVRAGLAAGAPVRWLAPDAVLEHAASHGLYGPVGAGLGGVSAGGGGTGPGPAVGTDA